MCTLLTPMKRVFRVDKRNFSRRCVAGFVGVAIFWARVKISGTHWKCIENFRAIYLTLFR